MPKSSYMSKKSFSPNDYKSGGLADPGKPKISLTDVGSVLSKLEGKILTIIDASFSVKEQNEAVKSLIRNSVWDEFDIVRNWYYEQDDNGKTPFPYGQNLIRE